MLYNDCEIVIVVRVIFEIVHLIVIEDYVVMLIFSHEL